MEVQQFVDEGLGNAAHLVISPSAGVAAVVDPLRDVDRYLEAAAAAGVRITHVFETHIHNDFVTGSRELAARTGAVVCGSAAAGLQFEHQPLRHGDRVAVGDVTFTVLATPGHTPEHVSYVARDERRPDQAPVLFSGGSLLVGSVARTDLLGHEHAVGLARELYRSLHDTILRLPDDTVVYPTHGAGSFCTAAPDAARVTTIGRERRSNPLLQVATPEEFARRSLQNLPGYPTYFRFMRAINRAGPRVLGGLPALRPLSPADVQARMARGEAVVDLRPVARYVEGHIPGAYHVELRPAFASWVGWVVPFATPVILVSDTTDVHEEAVRQLVRIGYDDLPGYLAGGVAAWERAGLPVARLRVLSVAEVRERLERGDPLLVVDVRQDAEWAEGSIPGAVHVEGGKLPSEGRALPMDRPIAVYCGHAARAATGLSLLERLGFRDLSLVDGGFGAWKRAGYPIQRAPVRSDPGEGAR
ncbi:MAG TPA: rhodanese-like domain-containing protein [Chloroflexota bacterium]